MSRAYYNEFDKYTAQWLRNLITAGVIAPGDVDERSIEDVTPNDLAGYTQCHFFAGIGAWSYALRRAGWPDDRPIWTGSCPCQPFSAAGQGGGFADERHLWPAFYHLISQRRPPGVFGEQVASKAVEPWIDLVHADMEGLGYPFGCVPFPSAGGGAPHIRDRAYWFASDGVALGDAIGKGLEGLAGYGNVLSGPGWNAADAIGPASAAGAIGGLGNPSGRGFGEFGGSVGQGRFRHADGAGDSLGRLADTERERHDRSGTAGTAGTAVSWRPDAAGCSAPVERVADAHGGKRHGLAVIRGDEQHGHDAGRPQECCEPQSRSELCQRPGPVNGFWRAADWLLCRDGKWRPVEPGTFPLVAGPAGRVGRSGPDWHTPAGPQGEGHRAGRLRGYGNAINAEAAVAFIQTVMEAA